MTIVNLILAIVELFTGEVDPFFAEILSLIGPLVDLIVGAFSGGG